MKGKVEGECGNLASPFVILGVTIFGDSLGEGQATIAVGREAPALGRESACLFPPVQPLPGTNWKFKMALLESEET